MNSTSSVLADFAEQPERYKIPGFQRYEVWDISRKQQLLDSILRGIKLPKFYAARIEGTDNYKVVDGQQRLSVIRDFIAGNIELHPLTVASLGLAGPRYEDLPKEVLVERFDRFPLEFDLIYDYTEKQLRELFLRLQKGSPLTAAEKLNAVHSKLRDYSKRLANHQFFKTLMKFTDSRESYFAVAANTVAVAIGGLDKGLMPDTLHRLYNRERNFSSESIVAQHVNETLGFSLHAFPATTRVLEERQFAHATATLASQLVAGGQSTGHEAEFGQFILNFAEGVRAQRNASEGVVIDQDYVAYIRAAHMSANSGNNGARKRHDILFRQLQKKYPQLAALAANDNHKTSWVPGIESENLVEYQVPPSTLKMVSTNLAVSTIELDRNRYAYADWQRRPVWGRAARQELIDSLLQGWTLPKLYVAHMIGQPGRYFVVDGQQRLRAIQGFIDGEFPLSKDTKAAFGLEGRRRIYFKDLKESHPELAAKISGHVLQVDEISGVNTDQDPDNFLREIKDVFLRLQQGMRLMGREKTHAAYGNLSDYASELSKHEFFKSRVRFKLPDFRHMHSDIAAKAVVVEVSGLSESLNLRDAGLRKVLAEHEDFAADDPIALRLNATMDFLTRAIPPDSIIMRNAPVVQSIITLAARLVETGHSAGHEAAFGEFIGTFLKAHYEQINILQDYYKGIVRDTGMLDQRLSDFAQTISADKVRGALTRHEVLMGKMAEMAPNLVAIIAAGSTPKPVPPAPPPVPPRNLNMSLKVLPNCSLISVNIWTKRSARCNHSAELPQWA